MALPSYLDPDHKLPSHTEGPGPSDEPGHVSHPGLCACPTSRYHEPQGSSQVTGPWSCPQRLDRDALDKPAGTPHGHGHVCQEP